VRGWIAAGNLAVCRARDDCSCGIDEDRTKRRVTTVTGDGSHPHRLADECHLIDLGHFGSLRSPPVARFAMRAIPPIPG